MVVLGALPFACCVAFPFSFELSLRMKNYGPAAQSLAMLCQTMTQLTDDANEHVSVYPDSVDKPKAWSKPSRFELLAATVQQVLPNDVRRLHPSYVIVGRDYARIEFGGGFYHYGYFLSRDIDKSTADVNVWDFGLYNDEHYSYVLMQFAMDSNEQLTIPNVMKTPPPPNLPEED